MLFFGNNNYQNYYEGNQSQSANNKNFNFVRLKIQISSISALHDPSEQLNRPSQLRMP